MQQPKFKPKYQVLFNDEQLSVEVRDVQHVIINNQECTNKVYDEQTKSIYAIIPADDSKFIIIQQKGCYIFNYDSNQSLLKNGRKYIFIDLPKASKIITAILYVGAVISMFVLFDKSWLFTFIIAAFYFFGTYAYVSFLKKPIENNKEKKTMFMICHCVLSLTVILCGFII